MEKVSYEREEEKEEEEEEEEEVEEEEGGLEKKNCELDKTLKITNKKKNWKENSRKSVRWSAVPVKLVFGSM